VPDGLLKISVLSSGSVLLDGRPVELSALEEALRNAKQNNGSVWYYRETPPANPSAQAMAVLNLVVQHKLPISLSSQPDFSDYVDAQGVSHPRTAAPAAPQPLAAAAPPELAMPEVDPHPDIEAVFASVRRTASGGRGARSLVVVTPQRKLLVMPVLSETPALRTMAANMDKFISSAVPRNVAAIAYTVLAPHKEKPDAADAARNIPFFGLLLGMSFSGHNVWVFEGHPSALAAGCRDADVLIVDSGMRPCLQADWLETVVHVMRNPNILVHNRATFQLAAVRKVGQRADRLEFNDD